MDKSAAFRIGQIFADDCIAFRVRALNRVVTNLYDAALKPFGITVNQTTMLAMLALVGAAGPGRIGKALVMEKSTVSRNLERMRINGWVAVTQEEGGKAQTITVTEAGRQLLVALHPEWEKVQAEAARLLGKEGVAAVKSLHETVRQTTGAA